LPEEGVHRAEVRLPEHAVVESALRLGAQLEANPLMLARRRAFKARGPC
jgi:hypothetical protein